MFSLKELPDIQGVFKVCQISINKSTAKFCLPFELLFHQPRHVKKLGEALTSVVHLLHVKQV